MNHVTYIQDCYVHCDTYVYNGLISVAIVRPTSIVLNVESHQTQACWCLGESFCSLMLVSFFRKECEVIQLNLWHIICGVHFVRSFYDEV